MKTTLNAAFVLTAVVVLAATAAPLRADPPESLSTWFTWQQPKADEVKAQAMNWLNDRKADESARSKAEALWSDLGENPPEDEILLRLAATFALADSKSSDLIRLCSKPKQQYKLPDTSWLTDPQSPELLTKNLRLIYARWLIQAELYDDAREQLAGLTPAEVAAPASLLFYQAVVYHELLEKESGLKVLTNLLDGPDKSPRRYIALARLMKEDLDNLKNDTLDMIARQMSDVRRRLDQGQAGKKVQGRQDGIMEGLQRMIENMERQQQQRRQQAQRGQPGQKRQPGDQQYGEMDPEDSIQSDSPLQDSVPMQGKGPGEVTKKDIGNQDDWGNLNPKEREEALQQIGRDFPSHFNDIMEQYFRRLAAQGSGEE
jgi:hypothetical protein